MNTCQEVNVNQRECLSLVGVEKTHCSLEVFNPTASRSHMESFPKGPHSNLTQTFSDSPGCPKQL